MPAEPLLKAKNVIRDGGSAWQGAANAV